MLRYTIPKLGRLQEQILKHFFECEQRKVESINHISKSVGAKRPSISRSAGYLIKEKYLALDRDKDLKLKREAGHKFFEKPLYVTDKGIFYSVVMLGIKFDDVIDYNEKYGDPSTSNMRQILDENFPNKEKRELFVRKGFEFFLKNNLFDEEGDRKTQLTKQEESRLRLHMQRVAFEHLESVAINNPGISGMNDIVEKAKIDRSFMKKFLIQRKKEIEQAIRELDEHPKN